MTYPVKVSTKGQLVIPAKIRALMGIESRGGNLIISYDPKEGEMTIARTPSFQEIQEKAKKYLNGRKVKPLLDPRAFYNTREPRI